MKLHEKIRHLRKTVLKVTLKDFHKKLEHIFGDDALTYYSLCRIEKGHRDAIRIKSLYQICTGIGISLKELKKGTDKEESRIVNIVKSSDKSLNRYVYNEKAFAEIVSPGKLKFLALELTLLPEGRTIQEEDPLETDKFEKLIIMLRGTLIAHIGEEKHTLGKGDSLSFASNIPHLFENPSKTTKTKCIIIQNPKAY